MPALELQDYFVVLQSAMDVFFKNMVERVQNSLKKLTPTEFKEEYQNYLHTMTVVSSFDKKLKSVMDLRKTKKSSANPDEDVDYSGMEKLRLNDTLAKDNQYENNKMRKRKAKDVSKEQQEEDSDLHVPPAKDSRLDSATENTKVQAIGNKGGKLSLYGCSISFPEESVQKDITFKLTVSNNRKQLPPNAFVITPFVSLEPHETFEKPVTVVMPTCYSAADGEEIPGQIWSKDKNGDWKKMSETLLQSENKVRFKVLYLCEVAVAVTDLNSEIGEYRLYNDVYIQGGTAKISSVFSQHTQALENCKTTLQNKRHISMMTLHKEIRCTLGSTYFVEVECTKPEKMKYEGVPRHPATFKVTKDTMKQQHICLDFKASHDGFLSNYAGVIEGNYYVTTKDRRSELEEKNGEDVATEPLAHLSIAWPTRFCNDLSEIHRNVVNYCYYYYHHDHHKVAAYNYLEENATQNADSKNNNATVTLQ